MKLTASLGKIASLPGGSFLFWCVTVGVSQGYRSPGDQRTPSGRVVIRLWMSNYFISRPLDIWPRFLGYRTLPVNEGVLWDSCYLRTNSHFTAEDARCHGSHHNLWREEIMRFYPNSLFLVDLLICYVYHAAVNAVMCYCSLWETLCLVYMELVLPQWTYK